MTKGSVKSIPQTADQWCARMYATDVTDTDRELFQAWLSESPENPIDYQMCELCLRLSRGAAEKSELHETTGSKRRLRKSFYAVAASIVVVAVTAMLLLQTPEPEYQTEVGEYRQVALQDGSSVDLNTDTTLDIDLKPNERVVELYQGEAFFDVAPDPDRPFIVRTESGEVRVVGTQFNVRLLNGEMLVTVVEGQVQVAGRSRADSQSVVDILPGEQALVQANRVVAKIDQPVVEKKVTSWRSGKIYFEKDTLDAVIREVNRYIDRQLVIEDMAVSEMKLTGVFRSGDLDSVLFALKEGYGLKTRASGDQLIVEKE